MPDCTLSDVIAGYFDVVCSSFTSLWNLNEPVAPTCVHNCIHGAREGGVLLRRQIVSDSHQSIRSLQKWNVAIKRLLSWVSQLPQRVNLTTSSWIAILQHAITVVIYAARIAVKAVLYTFALLILVPLAVTVSKLLLRLLLRLYRNHRRNRMIKLQNEQWRRQREEIEQRAHIQREAAEREWQQRDYNQRKARENQARRQREQDERLRREREQKQRQTEQAKRRQAVLDQWTYRTWNRCCLEFRKHREYMTSFPDPPVWRCTVGCADNEVLKACRHSITRLYLASGDDIDPLFLRKEKLLWHPDKFGSCPPEYREQFQAKATELFKIIQTLEEEYNAASQGRT